MSKSKPIAFFGTEDFSKPTLEKLIQEGWNIQLVITKPDSRRGRNKVYVPEVKKIAQKHSIDVLQPNKFSEVNSQLKSKSIKWGVLVAYGKIIPTDTLDIFKAVVNVHPSLLPKYRGASPIEQAILNGDKKTGISLIKLSEEMDAGDIYKQKDFNLNQTETKPYLYDKFSKLGADMVATHLADIITGKIIAEPQQGKPTYASMLKKSDAWIDWSLRAKDIERQIRAFLGWPGSKTKLEDREITITKAEIVDQKGNPGDYEINNSLIYFAKDKAIKILELTPAGKNNMPIDDFLRGL